MSDGRFVAVAEVLQRYFEGLYYSDTERLRQVFHPEAVYACASAAPALILDIAQYLPIVEQRPSPASRGESLRERILAIEFAGPVTAIAKLECSILPKHYQDFLTLLLIDGRWQIIAKVFHYELEA